ncbi:MAG: hypothetical protein ACRELW_19525 [Candidatus Rokuibacteriota bacterium]
MAFLLTGIVDRTPSTRTVPDPHARRQDAVPAASLRAPFPDRVYSGEEDL